MDNDAIQRAVKENPKVRCLFCLNFEWYCKKGLTPPCGRAFDPKGGNLVTV